MTQLNAETASEFDFVALIDASGSMGNPSVKMPGKTRWQEMQESLLGFIRAIEPFDADGIDVGVFGPNFEVEEGVTSATIDKLFASRGPRGSTPLHDAIAWTIDKQKKTGKKTFAVIFTDGEPNDQALVAKLITDASNNIAKDEDLTFLFIQIGDDKAARNYLDHLDDQLTGKFDIVDVVSVTEADSMEPLALINKAIAD
jgi:hypothetical protein